MTFRLRNNRFIFLFIFLFIGLTILLTGCQPKVYLMPPPVSLEPGSAYFELSEGNKDENLLYTLYATNRIPIENSFSSSGYTIFPSNTLKLGFAVHSVGSSRMSWDELYRQSLRARRDKELLINLDYTRGMAEYDKDDDLRKTSARADGFFDQVNRIIAASFDKDLTVYVHGANSNFYRATAQGAQYFHYTGHNSVVLTFSWPSAENLLKYKTDVLHAKQTVPAFARLLEILALHTNARKINILAYSAGAQLVAPGLASFRDIYPDLSTDELKKKLRIGEVYFAAPDTAFKPFIKRYLKFKDLVDRTTINYNVNDNVLRLAAFQTGVSRLGRPDQTELDDKEQQILIAATQTPKLNIIDAGRSGGLKLGGGHNFWYNNPWVSNDLLLLFLFNVGPEERGLTVRYGEGGVQEYYFPADYDTKIRQILADQKKNIPQKEIHVRGNEK